MAKQAEENLRIVEKELNEVQGLFKVALGRKFVSPSRALEINAACSLWPPSPGPLVLACTLVCVCLWLK